MSEAADGTRILISIGGGVGQGLDQSAASLFLGLAHGCIFVQKLEG